MRPHRLGTEWSCHGNNDAASASRGSRPPPAATHPGSGSRECAAGPTSPQARSAITLSAPSGSNSAGRVSASQAKRDAQRGSPARPAAPSSPAPRHPRTEASHRRQVAVRRPRAGAWTAPCSTVECPEQGNCRGSGSNFRQAESALQTRGVIRHYPTLLVREIGPF